jgi:hypothetical protein
VGFANTLTDARRASPSFRHRGNAVAAMLVAPQHSEGGFQGAKRRDVIASTIRSGSPSPKKRMRPEGPT